MKSTHPAPEAEPSAAFTPGPWAIYGGTVIISTAPWPMEVGPSWCDWEAQRGEPLGRFVAETRTDDAEGEACARLISAAPDQHAALLAGRASILALYTAVANGDAAAGARFAANDPGFQQIEAALAKALGREAASPEGGPIQTLEET